MANASVRMALFLLCLSVLGCAVFCGCAASKAGPLNLRQSSHNIVITRNNTLRIEKIPVEFTNLRKELVSRLIFERAFIVLHVHQQANQAFFQKVLDKLRQEGFKNVEPTVYSD